MTEQTKKRCFIITPIGGERSDVRDSLDGLLQNVLEPVLLDLDFRDEDITVAHQMTDSGSINTQLITRIIEDELCIVNLTGLNPNVMYELAVRHAVGKPVVIIAENGTKLPFDIVDQRTIFYHDTMLGAVQLKDSLKNMVSAILSKPEQIPDNPIIKIIKDNAILNEIEIDGKDHGELSLILNKISNLEERIVNNEKRNFKSVNNNEGFYSRLLLEYEGSINIKEIKKYWPMISITSVNKRNQDPLLNRIIIQYPPAITKDDIDEFRGFIEAGGAKVIKMNRVYADY